MRKIKFRAKYANSGKYTGGEYPDTDDWVYGDLIHFGEGADKPSIHADSGHGWYENYVVDPDTVGEYTGLNDKNGVEIYEGDIVRVDPTRINGREFDGYDAVVGFIDGNFGLERVNLYCHFDENEIEHGFPEPFFTCVPGTYLIIGNIHDNPELLMPSVEIGGNGNETA